VDYIFRWLGMTFLPGYREAVLGKLEQVPSDSEKSGTPEEGKDGSTAVNSNMLGTPAKETAGTPTLKTVEKEVVTDANSSQLERAGVAMRAETVSKGLGVRSEQFASFQTDAPACDNCGAITVRNGNCYLCHNCGNSMGCS